MAALKQCSILDNTVVAFLSDHGELLGHFGMLVKSIDRYPMLYDVGLMVPLIIRMPGEKTGQIIKDSVELIDLCPTLLECAGLDTAPEIQGYSLRESLSGAPVPERKYIFSESGAVKTIRGKRYKLVYYPGQPYGELYDILEDPLESRNLYDERDYRKVREKMIRDLLFRLIYTEAPLHGESKRGPAYWRNLYRMPFEASRQEK